MDKVQEYIESANALQVHHVKFDERSTIHEIIHGFNTTFQNTAKMTWLAATSIPYPMIPDPIELTEDDVTVRIMTCRRHAFEESWAPISAVKHTFEYDDEGYAYETTEVFADVLYLIAGNSHADIERFRDKVSDRTHPKSPPPSGRDIFRFNVREGQYERTHRAAEFDHSGLIGIDAEYEKIKGAITSYHKKAALFKRIGITAGLNILLYGPPGTGKTSVVKALTSEMKMPIYIANIEKVGGNSDVLTAMLSPSVSQRSIVLIEDFDRYLSGGVGMSGILNALDGVTPSMNVVRIFSANDPEIIQNNQALSSRMALVLKFPYPSIEALLAQCRRVFQKAERRLVAVMFQKIQEARVHVTLRDLNMFMVSYVMDMDDDPDQPIVRMMGDLEGWLERFKKE